jgi:hypothetical protein
MYTRCIGTAGQIEPAFAHLRAKIPKRNASLRKSLRSVFISGPTRAAGVYHSNAVMLFRLISLILSMVLEIILSEFLRWVLLLLWIQLKKKIILLNLKLKAMKSNNIWKIIIGAVSAALGYILNAIGL